jgi:hypothetical protein
MGLCQTRRAYLLELEDQDRRELLSDWWADRVRKCTRLGIEPQMSRRRDKPEFSRRREKPVSVLSLLLD